MLCHILKAPLNHLSEIFDCNLLFRHYLHHNRSTTVVKSVPGSLVLGTPLTRTHREKDPMDTGREEVDEQQPRGRPVVGQEVQSGDFFGARYHTQNCLIERPPMPTKYLRRCHLLPYPSATEPVNKNETAGP